MFNDFYIFIGFRIKPNEPVEAIRNGSFAEFQLTFHFGKRFVETRSHRPLLGSQK